MFVMRSFKRTCQPDQPNLPTDRTRHNLLQPILLALLLVSLAASSALALDWSPEEIVGGDDSDNDWTPSVDVTVDGAAWCVWGADMPEDIVFSVNDGSGWTPRQLVHPSDPAEDRSPKISSGADGVPWVVWKKNMGGGNHSLLVSHWDDAHWSEADTVRTGASRYDVYSIHVADSSDIWIITSTYEPPWTSRILLTYHWNGVEWEGPFALGFEETGDYGGDIAVSPDGTVWATWGAEGHAPGGDAVACAVFDGESWNVPEIVDSSPGNMGGGVIAFDEQSVPMVVWLGDGNTAANNVKYSRRIEGSWTQPGYVNEPDVYPDTNGPPNVDSSPSGGIWAAWTYGRYMDMFSSRVAASRWEGNHWSSEEAVSDTATTPGKFDHWPDVAVSPDSSVWVVWQCYFELGPFDEDIRASHGTQTTPVDFCCPESIVGTGSVTLSWYAGGSAAAGPFLIWRDVPAEGDICAPEPSEFTAICITPEPLAGGTATWDDESVVPGVRYCYWVEWAKPTGSAFLGPVEVNVPGSVASGPARILFAGPNPQHSGCTIGYEVAEAGVVGIEIYDVSGRRVARVSAGSRSVGAYDTPGELLQWDGRGGDGSPTASGVYFIQLIHDGRRIEGQTARVTVVR